jgi:hypothetical protein
MLEALYALVILFRIAARSYRIIKKNGAFIVTLATRVVSVHAISWVLLNACKDGNLKRLWPHIVTSICIYHSGLYLHLTDTTKPCSW